jgi:hypothetical protein
MRIRIAGLMLLVVAAGCGGGGSAGGSQRVTDVNALDSCLVRKGLQASTKKADLDLIAEDAGIGGVQVVSPGGQELNIAVERSESDAENTVSEYKALGLSEVRQEGNVVMAYTKTPTGAETKPVEACLSR